MSLDLVGLYNCIDHPCKRRRSRSSSSSSQRTSSIQSKESNFSRSIFEDRVSDDPFLEEFPATVCLVTIPFCPAPVY